MNTKQEKTLESLIIRISKEKANAKSRGDKTRYPEELKIETIAFREELNIGMHILSLKLGLSSSTLFKWSQKYKTENTVIGQIHGESVRYDVATKCMIIKRHIEEGIPGHKLAEEYNVSQGTISQWNRKYKYSYKLLIQSPEGTMVIGKESKRVIGLDNIKAMMRKKLAHAKEIRKLVIKMQEAGLNITEAEEKAHREEQEAESLRLAEEIMNRK